MSFTLESVFSVGNRRSKEIFNRGFEDYIIPTELDDAAWAGLLRHDGIDTLASQVIFSGTDPIGIGLIARRGWTSRLAAMSIQPDSRRVGAGSWLMAALIDQACGRGESTMVLEVIEANHAARNLYEQTGFTLTRRLFGYEADVLAPFDLPLDEIDPIQVARQVTMHALADLPWQLSGESLELSSQSTLAFQGGQAFAQLAPVGPDRMVLQALIVPPDARKQGHATRLLGALSARFPHRTWVVPALCPQELDAWMISRGFRRTELSQRQMILSLPR